MQQIHNRGRKRKSKDKADAPFKTEKNNFVTKADFPNNICSKVALQFTSPKCININSLPPHILGFIFSNLSPIERLRAEKVCRLWRYLGANYAWSNQATISYEEVYGSNPYQYLGPAMSNRHIEVLLKRARHFLRNLDLHHLNGPNVNYSLAYSFTHTRNIQTLNMSGIHLTNSSLSLIGRFLPDLKKLILKNSFKNTMMERGLSSLFNSCRRLEYLDLSDNEIFAGTSFMDLPTSLMTLNISGCFRIKPDAIRAIHENCSNLTELTMDQVDTLPTTTLNELFKALKKLVILSFSVCYGTDFYDGQPNLTSLGNLVNLKELHISDNLLINDEVLRSIGIGCKSLEFLNISSSNRHVTEAGLRQISNISKLNQLNLSHQRSLTDETLIRILHRGTIRNLVISKCPKISNESVIHAIRLCKNLRALDISYCTGVTHIIFKELDKSMALQHGKSQPNGLNDERRFQLSLSRSGIQGNVPDKFSKWIKIMDPECNIHPPPAILVAQPYMSDFQRLAGISKTPQIWYTTIMKGAMSKEDRDFLKQDKALKPLQNAKLSNNFTPIESNKLSNRKNPLVIPTELLSKPLSRKSYLSVPFPSKKKEPKTFKMDANMDKNANIRHKRGFVLPPQLAWLEDNSPLKYIEEDLDIFDDEQYIKF